MKAATFGMVLYCVALMGAAPIALGQSLSPAQLITAIEAGKKLADSLRQFEGVVKDYNGKILQLDHLERYVALLHANEASLLRMIDEAGAKGILMNALIFERTVSGSTEYAFAALLPGGIGNDVDDAALKALLSEIKLDDKFSNSIAAQANLPAPFGKPYDVSPLSFGLWLEKAPDGEGLVVHPVKDLAMVYATASQRWIIHRGRLITSRNAPILQRLAAEANSYQDLAKQYMQEAYTKGLVGRLEALMKAQEEARKLMADAILAREQAFARHDKWSGFATVAQLLNIASAVADANARAEQAQVRLEYYRSSVERLQIKYDGSKIEINTFFGQVFGISSDSLPRPMERPP